MRYTYIYLVAVIAASLYSCTALAHEIGKLPDGYIIGGRETDPNEYPWQVFMDIIRTVDPWRLKTFNCGGTLIGNNWVLTAAHCLDKARYISLLFGAHDISDDAELTRQTRGSDEYFIHEDYQPPKETHDIALVHFADPIHFTDAVQSIPLATKDPKRGRRCMITGWGYTSDNGATSDVLMEVRVLIAYDARCKKRIRRPRPRNMKGVICLDTTNGRSPCVGDSGGPLHVRQYGVTKVAGVSSFGAYPECEIGGPERYTSVAHYLDWIEEKTGITP